MKFLERALKCFRRDQTWIDTYSLWGFGFRVPSPGNEIESPTERRANRNIRRIFREVFDTNWQANRSMYVRMDDWTHAGEEDHLLSTTTATFSARDVMKFRRITVNLLFQWWRCDFHWFSPRTNKVHIDFLVPSWFLRILEWLRLFTPISLKAFSYQQYGSWEAFKTVREETRRGFGSIELCFKNITS